MIIVRGKTFSGKSRYAGWRLGGVSRPFVSVYKLSSLEPAIRFFSVVQSLGGAWSLDSCLLVYVSISLHPVLHKKLNESLTRELYFTSFDDIYLNYSRR